MTRRSATLALLAVLALAAAALLVALARGVVAVDDGVRSLETPSARIAIAEDSTGLDLGPGDRVARTFLAVDDDLDFRRALGLVEASRGSATPGAILELHAEAIAVLQRLTEADPADRASRAATMTGALYVEDALIDPQGAPRYFQLATESFQRAVRLDAANEAAKLGLELQLRRTAFGESDQLDEGTGGGVTGASERPAGTGY